MNEEKLLNQGDDSMIETPQELMDSTIAKVEAVLNEKFPEYVKFDAGSYTISRGSTQVMILVRPFTEDETCIECMSNVVTGAIVTSELMQFLLRKNAELHIGAFGLLFDNTIVFQHSIAGTNVDSNELELTVNTVAVIADHYDDKIVEMAGGKRANELADMDS